LPAIGVGLRVAFNAHKVCASIVGDFMSAARPKKAVNVAIPVDLLEAARACDINISATLEAALEQRLRERRRDEWRSQNADEIKAYNLDVEEHGVFSESQRSF
jgi:antitoxin CcdA